MDLPAKEAIARIKAYMHAQRAVDKAQDTLINARSVAAAARSQCTILDYGIYLVEGEIFHFRHDIRTGEGFLDQIPVIVGDITEPYVVLLKSLKTGECWCNMGVGNPMIQEHSDLCTQVQALLKT